MVSIYRNVPCYIAGQSQSPLLMEVTAIIVIDRPETYLVTKLVLTI